MTIEEIKTNYANTMQFDNWDSFITYNKLKHPQLVDNIYNNLYQLIQDELKKKIANIEDIKIEHVDEFGDYIDVIGTEKETILNTENIK
ncbi:hypothetical protein F0358_10670 [Empedobacter brevis]|uniref:hypothetical protein n=1 Tax=Empedobacter brevis TaxID=247 RepID=UPI00123D04F1|nr:hypothetical protein [Empedobacter brevis]QES93137.1 hypothetical protein F0358_10670 [Empedobacter brevis]